MILLIPSYIPIKRDVCLSKMLETSSEIKKAHNYNDLFRAVEVLQKSGMYYFHLDFFLVNLGAVSNEHGEHLHQDISSIQMWY